MRIYKADCQASLRALRPLRLQPIDCVIRRKFIAMIPSALVTIIAREPVRIQTLIA
jgi:hypothetical protein